MTLLHEHLLGTLISDCEKIKVIKQTLVLHDFVTLAYHLILSPALKQDVPENVMKGFDVQFPSLLKWCCISMKNCALLDKETTKRINLSLPCYLQQKIDISWIILKRNYKQKWINEYIINLINGLARIMQLMYEKLKFSENLKDLVRIMQKFILHRQCKSKI